MAVKSITRKVLYYELQVFDNELKNQYKAKLLRDVIEKAFPKDTSVKVADMICIDNLSISENFFFGSIGKNKDFSLDPLIRYRDEKDLTTKPVAPNTKFERFTFFLINFKTSNISVIYNSEAPSLRRHLSNYLNEQIFINIGMARILTKPIDLDEKLGKWKKITKYQLTVSPDQIYGSETPGLRLIRRLETSHALSLKIELKVVGDAINDEVISDLKDFDPKEFEKYKLYGENDDGLSDDFDMIDHVMTKKTRIDLSDDEISNEKIVYERLIQLDREL